MTKKKFSINLEDKDIAKVDAFVSQWNDQSLVKIDRAQAIRMLIRAGARDQAYLPDISTPHEDRIHLNGESCGHGNYVGLSEENLLTCPKCIFSARHHQDKEA